MFNTEKGIDILVLHECLWPSIRIVVRRLGFFVGRMELLGWCQFVPHYFERLVLVWGAVWWLIYPHLDFLGQSLLIFERRAFIFSGDSVRVGLCVWLLQSWSDDWRLNLKHLLVFNLIPYLISSFYNVLRHIMARDVFHRVRHLSRVLVEEVVNADELLLWSFDNTLALVHLVW